MPPAVLSQRPGIYVYSAVTSGYDLIFPPSIPSRAVEFVLFSDAGQKARGWSKAPCVRTYDSTVLTNRFHKFFPQQLFPNAQYSVYIDGNIGIVGDITPLLDEFIVSGAALGVFRHRDRMTVAQEVDACLDLDRFNQLDLEIYESQVEHMYSEGMPPEQQLTDNGVIFRWHGHAGLASAMEGWWEELNAYTRRDQLSLPYILWRHELPCKIWDWSFRLPNPYFEKYPHKGGLLRNIRSRMKNISTKLQSRRGP
jgi:hypothetical protein